MMLLVENIDIRYIFFVLSIYGPEILSSENICNLRGVFQGATPSRHNNFNISLVTNAQLLINYWPRI
jgi:hypothetical protein